MYLQPLGPIFVFSNCFCSLQVEWTYVLDDPGLQTRLKIEDEGQRLIISAVQVISLVALKTNLMDSIYNPYSQNCYLYLY